MDSLQSVGKIEGLHLVKHTSRLSDYIFASDVCLLPSWFVGESLPLTVIEFLAQGKPAIVSDIGLCPWAISCEDQVGGFVVSRNSSGMVSADDLEKAMVRFVEDRSLAASLGSIALSAFKKFDMDAMLLRYTSLARRLLERSLSAM